MTQQRILLMDDDDAELKFMAFKEASSLNPLIRTDEGVEALDYRLARGKPAGRRDEDLPAMVSLDLNLQRLGGFEILAAIRLDDPTRRLPVVILASSTDDEVRFRAQDHHANSDVHGPVDHDRFVLAAHPLGLYWTLLNLSAPRKMP